MLSGCTSQKNNTDSSGCTSAVVKHDPAVLSQQILIAELHQDTINYRDRIFAVGGSISAVDLRAIDRLLVRPAYADGWRSAIDDCSPLAGNNLAAAAVKLWHPAGVQSNLSLVNFVAGDFSRSGGLDPGSPNSSKYCSTGIIPATHLNLSTGHASFFSIKNVTSGITTEVGAGTAINERIQIRIRRSDNGHFFGLIGGSFSFSVNVAVDADVRGLHLLNRAAINDLRGYKNNTEIGSNTGTNSGALASVPIVLFALNIESSGLIEHSPRACGFYSIGSRAIPTASLSSFNQSVVNFMRYMGRA